ncbi:protein singed wings 2-like [Pollicipes pollicipes]|uniref:protein singed wings 2-like n=1 Tax=Pollicipes pollicipes TaxID=41117 RepID=UPI001884C435|nr:protein singed wings 2-like [Pollicipes pollicipes]
MGLEWLDGLPSLRTLNLSNNPLQTVVGYRPLEEVLVSLDLSHSRLNCSDERLIWLYSWQLDAGRQLARANATRCAVTRVQYATIHGLPVLAVLRLALTVQRQCPSAPPFGCSCDLVQVQYAPDSGTVSPVILEVHCDSRGLHSFPPQLPEGSTLLSIKNNSLTDLGPVIGNHSSYSKLTTVYLDGNLLEAEDVNQLEGSDLIDRYAILSLTRNRLQTLPIHAFEYALRKESSNVDSLYLEGNPWLCDCTSPFTFTFKSWLVSRNKLLRNRLKIRCGSGPLASGPPPSPPLLSLSWRELCGGLQINWWDVTNGLLAAVLLVMAARFAYDVAVYRRTGKLPLLSRPDGKRTSREARWQNAGQIRS